MKVDHPRGAKFSCHDCDAQLSCHDHIELRRWRHLDSCQFKTILIARILRVKCPALGNNSAAVP
ncbi:MAG: transposase family protein [Novipirellula sp. JB048]